MEEKFWPLSLFQTLQMVSASLAGLKAANKFYPKIPFLAVLGGGESICIHVNMGSTMFVCLHVPKQVCPLIQTHFQEQDQKVHRVSFLVAVLLYCNKNTLSRHHGFRHFRSVLYVTQPKT